MAKYFKPAEFACRHCGENKMDPAFVERLDKLRERVQMPLVVSSGYRCPTHNQRVSSTGPNGPHTTGKAVDLALDHAKARVVLLAALDMGFAGIGVQQKGTGRFIHLDDTNRAFPMLWSY